MLWYKTSESIYTTNPGDYARVSDNKCFYVAKAISVISQY